MAAVWYAKIGERQYGPLGFDQLQRLASAGKLTRKSHVRQGEQGAWTTAASIGGLFDAPKAAAAPAPPVRKPAAAPAPARAATPARAPAAARAAAPAAARPAAAGARRAPPPFASSATAVSSEAPTVATPIPLGQALASTQTMASGESAVMKRSGENKNQARHGKRKKQTPVALVIGGIAGVVVTLVALVAVMYYTFTRNAEDPATVAKADAKKAGDAPADAAATKADAKADAKKAGDPAAAVADGKGKADAKGKPAALTNAKGGDGDKKAAEHPTELAMAAAATVAPSGAPGGDPRLALVKGTRAWSDASVGRPWVNEFVSIQLVNQWRADAPADTTKPAVAAIPEPAAPAAPTPAPAPEAKAAPKPEVVIDSDIAALLDKANAAAAAKTKADEAAKKAAAPAPAAPPAAKPAEKPAVEKGPTHIGGKYVFLELSIKNTSARSELKYAGWNGDKKTAAVMAWNGEKICELAPLETVPLANRLTTTVLAPGDEVTDVLVFEAHEGDLETLNLLLPLMAFGRKGNLAVSIPSAMLTDGSSLGPHAPKAKGAKNAEAASPTIAPAPEGEMPEKKDEADLVNAEPKKNLTKGEQAQEDEKADLDRILRGEPDPAMKKPGEPKPKMEDDAPPPAQPKPAKAKAGAKGAGKAGAGAMPPPGFGPPMPPPGPGMGPPPGGFGPVPGAKPPPGAMPLPVR